MRILFFTRRFYPYLGGVEKHVFEISQILINKGHTVTILTEMPSGSSTKSVEIYKGIKIYRIDSGKDDWFKKFRIWKALFNLKHLIKNADVIHCHDIFFWYLPFRLLYFTKPVYTTFHGHEDYPIRKKSIALRKIFEMLSNGTLLVSDALKKWYHANPTYVIYGAVTLPKYNKREVLTKKKIQIALIGRLDNDRGIDVYTNVLKLLKKRKIPYTFTVVGDGPLRKKLEKYGEIKGFVSDTNSQIAKSDVVFASSYLSILEALAMQKIVVAAYDNPLKRDCLLETPFTKFTICDSNAESIADRIAYLKEHNKERENLLQNAYKWVSKQTWEEMTKTYLRLWKLKESDRIGAQ